MARVGKQRERAGRYAAGYLGEHESAGDERSKPHAPLAIGLGGAMRMAMPSVGVTSVGMIVTVVQMRSHNGSHQSLARV
jgi:hypothetical protein